MSEVLFVVFFFFQLDYYMDKIPITFTRGILASLLVML